MGQERESNKNGEWLAKWMDEMDMVTGNELMKKDECTCNASGGESNVDHMLCNVPAADLVRGEAKLLPCVDSDHRPLSSNLTWEVDEQVTRENRRRCGIARMQTGKTCRKMSSNRAA